MSAERILVRCYLTACVLVISIIFVTPFVALKLLEGVFVAYQITAECIKQVWKAKGIPEFDRYTQG